MVFSGLHNCVKREAEEGQANLECQLRYGRGDTSPQVFPN